MGIDFEADLTEQLTARDHGAVVVHSSGRTEGILNQEFLSVDAGGNVEVGGSEPALYVKTSWGANVSAGDTLTVTPTSATGELLTGRRQRFKAATEPEPDGNGLSRIALQAVVT